MGSMKSGICLHRILELALLIFFASLFFSSQTTLAGDVRLAWDSSSEPTLAGYRLGYGEVSGQYSTILNVGNTTTYTVTGLTPGTYYFAVKAYTGAGVESGYSNEVSTIIAAASDTQPPVISGLASLNITISGATVVWTTNEPSDSQIEYGTTANYGSSTSLVGNLVTSHSQTLSGLLSGTTYHLCVKSRDAAGNLSVSGDYTFTTLQGGGPALTISGISVSKITNNSATISWSTNNNSDSEVEYWIDGADIKKAALRIQVTSHLLTLNHLLSLTQYHFIVRSADLEGNQANSQDFTFSTTAYVPSAYALPRLSAGPNPLGDEIATGLAFTNTDSRPDSLTFTAMEENGNLMSGGGIVNPISRGLDAYSQWAIVDWQMFGSGYLNSNSSGWIKINSASGTMNGLFLIFDTDLTLLDGANFSDPPLTNFAFTEIQESGRNKISVINNNSEYAVVDFQLVGAYGNIRAAQSRMIPNNGSLTADLFTDLFAGIEPDSRDYVQVKSSKSVQSYQVMRQGLGDIASLTGQDVSAGATVLYSPQYVHGESYRTSLSVINLDTIPGAVSFEFFREDGIQMGNTRLLAIPANGKLYVEDPEFFLPLDLNKTTAGYVKITSNGIRLAGSTLFGDRSRLSFTSALALVSELQTSILYSHVASNDLYFTGLAIVNPNPAEASVIIELYNANGFLLDQTTKMIVPGGRDSKLLTQYFPSLEGKDQTSGYIKLVSNLPIASFATFGTNTLSVLSAIPPQIVP
jgi:hypothetical protein